MFVWKEARESSLVKHSVGILCLGLELRSAVWKAQMHPQDKIWRHSLEYLLVATLVASNVTRLDDFLKFLFTKFPSKVVQIYLDKLGLFRKTKLFNFYFNIWAHW